MGKQEPRGLVQRPSRVDEARGLCGGYTSLHRSSPDTFTRLKKIVDQRDIPPVVRLIGATFSP